MFEPNNPSSADPTLVTAERLRDWCRRRVGISADVTETEARRSLAKELSAVDFEPESDWIAAAQFAAADVPKVVDSLRHPIAFVIAEDAAEVDQRAAELHRIWKSDRSEQQRVLPAFEQSLSPLAQARFAPVLEVLKADAPTLLPIKCDVARALVDDAVSIALAPGVEPSARRRELVQSRTERTERKTAALILSNQRKLAGIDDAFFAAVSGVQRNVHVGLPKELHPVSRATRLMRHAFFIGIILSIVLPVIRQSFDPSPPSPSSPPTSASSSQSPRSNGDVSRRLASAEQLSRRLQAESEFSLQASPPSPGWILPVISLLEADECEKLLRVYSSDGVRERFKGDSTFDANREKVIAALTKRVEEFDEERRSQSLSGSEPMPVTPQDPNTEGTRTASNDERTGIGVVIELPRQSSPELESARRLSNLYSRRGRNSGQKSIIDEINSGSAPRVMIAVPSPKPDDPNAVEIRPIKSVDDIRQWGPKLPIAVKKALLKQFESIRLSNPLMRREVAPIISELEDQIEAQKAAK